MLTHFTQLKLRQGDFLSSPIDSLVYSLLPADRLVLQGEVVERVMSYLRNHPGEASEYGSVRAKDITDALDYLVRQKAAKEVHGARLKRFLESF